MAEWEHGIEREAVAKARREAAQRRASAQTRRRICSRGPDASVPDRQNGAESAGNRRAQSENHAPLGGRRGESAARELQSARVGSGKRAGRRRLHHLRDARHPIRRVRADGRDVPDGPPPTVHGQGGDGQVAGHRQMVPRGRHATGAATQRQGARDRRGVGTDSHEQSCADNLARGNGDARPEKSGR